MTINEIKDFIAERRGYLKKSADVLSERLNCPIEDCETALYEARKLAREENTNDNDSVISEFEQFLDKNGISQSDVASVKFWQTVSGQQRFSVVTKGESMSVDSIKKEIEGFAERYSPEVDLIPRKQISRPVAYEISLPDIHYGKLHDLNLEQVEQQYMTVVQELVSKAAGLEIERFILPVGNDGMNSEGMRRTTTKGTPQEESAGWKDTFRGYWRLMTRAVNYLKEKAPVDIIVVSGNHDYERMFYAGDVLAGWYRNDANVTVDNGYSSRKYYEYGKNMIMFTRCDDFFLRIPALVHALIVGRQAGYPVFLLFFADDLPHGTNLPAAFAALQSTQPRPWLRPNHFLSPSLAITIESSNRTRRLWR
jgi:hypothetical protein